MGIVVTVNPDPFESFKSIEMRVGTVREARVFEKARVPALKLQIDFGELGVRWSSAQITDHYQPENLIGRQVIAVVNLPPKRIAGFKSECLVLGIADELGKVVLLMPDTEVPDGHRVY